jgi:hypothetical protein
MACGGCPFAFTDESEYIQGLGCLPSPYDIIQMKRKSGHNWGCHSNEKVVCKGFSDFVKESQKNDYVDNMKDIDTSKGKIISYDVWYREGEEGAIQKAK